ncbi:hypothetical protein OG455_32195 [Kitasatospora sp. NBC_01287]|uniref:hypothetical protein n=1 Tax=Kitasatospora sp. NBC_01287 TaxID=2903573 RepID=UPI00224E003F|nr:hypothetical protein [Kitasatospora sp. NBC_01287]MCX4750124.1 hypothetical protein [Kitasatospora sp. NBC_01287]
MGTHRPRDPAHPGAQGRGTPSCGGGPQAGGAADEPARSRAGNARLVKAEKESQRELEPELKLEREREREILRMPQPRSRAARRPVNSPSLKAMLLTRQARGHAKLGEREACLRALGAAAEFAATGPSEEDPGWLYWINSGEIAGQAGSCHLDLGEPRDAAVKFEAADASLNPADRRTRALFEARAASAHLRSGEREAGFAAVESVLELAVGVQSPRLHEHLGRTADDLRSFGGGANANALIERADLLLAQGS